MDEIDRIAAGVPNDPEAPSSEYGLPPERRPEVDEHGEASWVNEIIDTVASELDRVESGRVDPGSMESLGRFFSKFPDIEEMVRFHLNQPFQDVPEATEQQLSRLQQLMARFQAIR